MTRITFVLLGCFFALNSVFAAEEPKQFAKPITLPAIEGEELIAVPLDTEVYANSLPDYLDLRVLDGQKNEIAYVLRRGQTKRSRKVQQTWSAEKLALKPLDEGGLEIRFQVDPQKHLQPPQGIRFFSPLVNFEHHVKVESSTDGESWNTLVDNGLIFDYSQFMDVRNVTLDLPSIEGQPQFYRLTIADVTQEQQSQLMELSRSLKGDEEQGRTERTTINRQPFRIDRIELWIDEVRQDVIADREVEYPVKLDKVEQDPKAKQSLVYLTSQREPLTEITIDTPNRNFSRNARIEIPAEQGTTKTWQTLGTANLARIDFRTLKREALGLDIPETRGGEYRLVIENRDSPPLEVKGATAEGHVYEVVFLAAKEAKYDLTYGNDSLAAPNYDTATLAASLREGFTPLVATLGDQVEVDAPLAPAVPLLTRLLNDSRVMTLVIGVLVLILAAGLYRATRHLDDLKEG
ncbi:MAG: DUF3999 family protein [Bythopirellula sp.]|nr:DUF3999 family protein [Bythopirellula sp.]